MRRLDWITTYRVGPPIRLYLFFVIALSALCVIASVAGLLIGRFALGDLWWFASSVLLIGLATARPVELRPHVRLSPRFAPKLMAAVLLGPPAALLAAGAGVSVGYLYHLHRRRHDLTDLLFNTAQDVLGTLAASLVYALVSNAPLSSAGEPLALLAAAETMHLSNILLVAGAISLSGQDVGVSQTVARLFRTDPLQYAALAVTGILGALLAREQAFWAVPLLLVPLALVERTLIKQREEAERERKLAVMEEVNALKNDFIAAVTHDLRTPLMVIKGFGELLAEREDEFMDDERRAVECINLNTERLSELIEMLLQLSEIDAGMVILQPAPTDAPEVVQRVLDQVNFHAEQKDVTVALFVQPPAPPIELDPARFEQVVANLVNNAIKFTPQGGEVAVTVGFRDEHLVITVNDSGPGISPEALPHIFERFYRAHIVEGDRRRTGGLGLTIAKSIVELHGGTITVESRVNQGTTFTVRLPQLGAAGNLDQGPNAHDRALTQGLHPARPLPNAR
jgi:signal transduction histidine kinase